MDIPTFLAMVFLSSPLIFFLLRARLVWEIEPEDILNRWKGLKVLSLILFTLYFFTIAIFGHEEIAASDYGAHNDGWFEYYVIPGFLFSITILPKVVGNEVWGTDEEVALFFGWLFLVIWSSYLLIDWNYIP